MAIFWNLKAINRLMAERGIATQQELNRRAKLSRLTMHNISRSGRLTRLDIPTIEALTRALGLSDPWSLLTYTPDPD